MILIFEDGTIAPVRLTYGDLYELELSGKWKEDLDEFFRLRENGMNPKRKEFDMLRFLHVAYLCANKESENLMDWPTFIHCVDIRQAQQYIAAYNILWVKKKISSQEPSEQKTAAAESDCQS